MLLFVTNFPVRGLRIIEHRIPAPLNHAQPDGDQISLFVREVSDPVGADKPPLLFLQGGPGVESPRPTGSTPPWLKRALQDFRVLFLDQRGTGQSGAIDSRLGLDPISLAQRLTHYRADSIVEDAELIRKALSIDQWSLLGQSFGGFVALRYLSCHPDSLKEVLFTGGLPPVGRPIDEVYAATYGVMDRKSKVFFARFPDALQNFRRAEDACAAGSVILPTGERLSPHRLRSVGHLLGMSAAEQLNYLFSHEPKSAVFAHDVLGMLPFNGRNPIYALLHEACYADGGVTGWSAQRQLPERASIPTPLLTGEHLFKWHFEEVPGLIEFGETANWLAAHTWPTLYDADALSRTEVPCAAVVYGDDAFVVREFSEQTSALLPNIKVWLTNEYEHNGLRASGDRVFGRLIDLVRNRVD
jgi:pimeloyl-ACP methyl ester carboxylesterase